MKITSVDIIAPRMGQPVSGAYPVLCRVNTDAGIYGYGEATLSIGVAARPVFETIKSLAGLIFGMDPFEHEVIWEKLRHLSYWALSGGVIHMAAMSAIDIALWDIRGKACNLPVYKLLGGKQREKLRSYASQVHFGWGIDPSAPDCPKTGSPEWFFQSCKNAAADGYDAVKIGLLMHSADGGRLSFQETTGCLSQSTLNMAEARLAAAREALGPNADIILENHALTDGVSSIQLLNMAEKYGIFFVEEATAPLNPQVMRRIADKTNIPLATGERTYSRWGFLPFLENGSLTVLQPDVGTCGGITEFKKICDMAHTYDVSIQGHQYITGISYAATLHLEAAIPNFTIHEHHITTEFPANIALCTNNYRPVNGYIEIPDLPGLGQELTEETLRTADIETVK